MLPTSAKTKPLTARIYGRQGREICCMKGQKRNEGGEPPPWRRKLRRINAAAIGCGPRPPDLWPSRVGNLLYEGPETQRRRQAATTAAQAPSISARQRFAAGRTGTRQQFAAGRTGREGLEAVTVGRPLLYTVDDCRTLVDMIARYIKADGSLPQKDAQVVLVGHGSDSPANAIYSQIDYLAKDEGRAMWHVGTIEGYPSIGCVERRLKLSKAKNVILVPLLYIAGNHQKEDIDGAWRKQLTADGYRVSVVGRGLGEMREVQDMIIESIRKNIGK